VIRFTLRQFRTEALIGFGGLVVVAVVLAITGPHLVHVYDSYVSACKADGNCASTSNPITATYPRLQLVVNLLVLVVPALVGIFWGAPLIARELETGTFRLAWTQSLTRTRWLAAKLGIVGLASAVLGGLLSLMSTWWMNPISLVDQNRFSPANFGLGGITPFGYAAFGFALGVTAGVILRRTVPAMLITLVGFIAARLAVAYWIRPYLESPVQLNQPLNAQNVGFSISNSGVSVVSNVPNLPNALVISAGVVNKQGAAPTDQFLRSACPGVTAPQIGAGPAPQGLGGAKSVVHANPGLQGAFHNCIVKLSSSFHVVIQYQPANRYWPFQIYETAIFVIASLLLGALSWWWIRRRLT
jgi:hypothetical protein